MALGALAVGSLPWLVPSVLHTVYADPGGVAAFAARADTPFGSIGSLVMLGGMWNATTVPKAYGGPWSAVWLVVVLAAVAGYVLLGPRRWPPNHGPRSQWLGLAVGALAGLLIASIGVTAAGRALLRGAIGWWPGFAILRDGQQFTAPLALAEAIGFGLAVSWSMHPGSFGTKKTAERPGGRHRAPALADAPGLALGVFALVAPVLLLPGLAWGAAGRLRPAWYPAAYQSAAATIDASRVPGDVLLLPWAADRTPFLESRRGDARRVAPAGFTPGHLERRDRGRQRRPGAGRPARAAAGRPHRLGRAADRGAAGGGSPVRRRRRRPAGRAGPAGRARHAGGRPTARLHRHLQRAWPGRISATWIAPVLALVTF